MPAERPARTRIQPPTEGANLTHMDNKIFERFSEFIKAELGIKMPASKKTLLEARLQKRLRELGISTHEEYCEYLFSPRGMDEELVNLVDVVTTNTTDFFREPKHFEQLTNVVLPALTARGVASRGVQLWSAGCSSGEEPYTLAMKEVGIDTVIIIRSGYKRFLTYPSKYLIQNMFSLFNNPFIDIFIPQNEVSILFFRYLANLAFNKIHPHSLSLLIKLLKTLTK